MNKEDALAVAQGPLDNVDEQTLCNCVLTLAEELKKADALLEQARRQAPAEYQWRVFGIHKMWSPCEADQVEGLRSMGAEVRALYSYPIPSVLYSAHNKTSDLLFVDKGMAEEYAASCGPSAGVLVSERPVVMPFTAPALLQPPQPDDPAKIWMRRRNDCYTALLAMLLGLPYEEVPLFFENPEDVTSPSFNEWVDTFLSSRGLARVCITVNEKWLQECQRGYAIVSGPSPSKEFQGTGTFHAVLYKDGSLFHDPKPCPEGAIVPEQMEIIYHKDLRRTT